MRAKPSHTLLSKCVAFYFFCHGLSADHVADLLGINRRTLFKWMEQDDWKARSNLLALEFRDHKLCPENIAWIVRRYAEADQTYRLFLNQPRQRPLLFNPDLTALALKGSVSWPSLLRQNFPHLL